MARQRRFKVKGEDAYYHVISRTVGQEFYLGDREKETMVRILQHYAKLYFVKVIGFCIMSNHFHLVIKMEPGDRFDDDEVAERVVRYLKVAEEHLNPVSLQKYREKLENLSEFVRSLKQTFSRWYNGQHERTGYFWGGRFKSVLLEPGRSLVTCLTYVDLNPVRARMVELPEQYRWCGVAYRVAGKNDGGKRFLHFDGVFEERDPVVSEGTGRWCQDERELLADYRYLLYKAGNMKVLTQADIEAGREARKPAIADEVYHRELARGFEMPGASVLMRRVRYFSDGLVVGSKGFIQDAYRRFENLIHKKDRCHHATDMGKELYSIKNLRAP